MRDKSPIIKKIKETKCDALLLFDATTRYWLTGFHSSDGVVVLSKDETALFLDGRYTEKAYAEKPDAKIYPCSKSLFQTACEYILEKEFKAVVVDSARITLSLFEGLKSFFDGKLKKVCIKTEKDFLSEFISIKNHKEISLIKEAVKITDDCFSHILKYIKAGVYESDIAAEINYYFHKNGCESAFDTIVVSGVKSSMPHGEPDKTVLTENSFITMDFGAKYKGYCADMTRTVVLGKADNEMRKIYSIVNEANSRGIEKAKAGVLCCDVDKAAREYIEENGYGEYFTHSTGHSFGVEIHESPSVSRLSQYSLKCGNVITIEPGIYIPNKYGVRIEDTLLIGEDTTEVLSRSAKELIEL